MKAFYCLIMVLLALNAICESPHKAILSRFMDGSVKDLFKVYHLIFKKSYSIDSETAIQRFRNFKTNLKIIKEHNAKGKSYTYGINQFTDLTREEFRQQHLTNSAVLKKQLKSFMQSDEEDLFDSDTVTARPNVDWTKLFIDARDQGQCGSCWAFATAGAIEGNWFNKNQNSAKITLSTQQLVDCDSSNGGCNGGWYDGALTYAQKTGLVEEKNYPYKGEDGTCSVPAGVTALKIESYKSCNSCSIDAWWALFAQGPIAIAVDANSFMMYDSGILVMDPCDDINHAILAVGWSTDSSGEILTIRNSWTTGWGENGLARIRVNLNDKACHMTEYAYLPIVGGTPPPPPPPTDCFNVSSTFKYNAGWKLPSPYYGSVNFKATGTDFVVSVADQVNGTKAYNLYVASSNTSSYVTLGTSTTKTCTFPHAISSTLENTYKITYTGMGIVLTINNVSFTCTNMTNAARSNFVGFGHNGRAVTTAKICGVTVTN
jgi:C1A family cysteine protease